MSPRIAGTLIATFAVVGAVGSGWLIATPPFSVPGAILLTVVTVAFAYGVLLSMRIRWRDPHWSTRPPNRRRTQRFLFGLCVYWLVAAPAAFALTVSSAIADGFTGNLIVGGFLSAASGFLGATSVLRLRAFMRNGSDSTDRTATGREGSRAN